MMIAFERKSEFGGEKIDIFDGQVEHIIHTHMRYEFIEQTVWPVIAKETHCFTGKCSRERERSQSVILRLPISEREPL